MIEELNGDFLQWLRGFYFIARTGSVRKAAEQMHRNPSTVSYQLRCLEEQLQTVLFDRHKKTMRITHEGKELLGWAISTFETLNSLRSSVGNARGEIQGNIHMAGTLPIVTLAVPAITKFTQAHPRVKLNIERGISYEVRKKVEDSEADFGLLPMTDKCESEKLDIVLKARPLLVLHKDNPWQVPRVPDEADLRRLPYVAVSVPGRQDEPVSKKVDMYREFIDKNAVITLNNYHLAMRFIWQKLGVGIMDELCWQATNFGAEWSAISVIPLDHLLPNLLYGILTRRNKHISPQANTLICALRDYFLFLPSINVEDAWQRARQNDAHAGGVSQKDT